jgi:hypothetical protein
MVASVAVLRAAPARVVFDEWLLRVDNQARRAFVLLLCKFGAHGALRGAVGARRGVHACRVRTHVSADGAARRERRRIAAERRRRCTTATAIDVLDGVLTLANMALHVAGGRRYIAALVTTALRVQAHARGAVSARARRRRRAGGRGAGGAAAAHVLRRDGEALADGDGARQRDAAEAGGRRRGAARRRGG